ncbi:MAG: DUF3667 domain-containing protein [Woeseiaceae bacterium]
MTERAGPVHESTFFVNHEVDAEFQAWLEQWVAASLQHDGITSAHHWQVSSGQDDVACTILQLGCSDNSALDELLDTYLADIEIGLADAFGELVSVHGRALREDDGRDASAIDNPNCLNCGARLGGQYCGTCGQRSLSRLISIWQLLAEAFGDLFELDSRLWRTLRPLLIRPGQLTRDYLLGRRARYMPPFRMYLVLSVIFFVVAFFDPRDDLGLLFEPEPPPTPEEEAARNLAVEQAKQEILDELGRGGVTLDDAVPAEQLDEAGTEHSAARDDDHKTFRLDATDTEAQCDIDSDSIADWPDWFKRRLTPDRLEVVCNRVLADNGATFLDLLIDNIPVALIVLMPLMALVLKILYPLSRRYFVEHLLFIVHFHAFFFLILTLQILFSRTMGLLGAPDGASMLVIVAAALYIPVYLYMAMRRVYAQRRIFTIIKYLALMVAYWLGVSLTMFGAITFALLAVSTGSGGAQP